MAIEVLLTTFAAIASEELEEAVNAAKA